MLLMETTSLTLLLDRWAQGDRAALEQLAPRVHNELQALARSYLKRGLRHQTLQPNELINEAWIRLIDQTSPPKWGNRAHFFGVAARLMRFVLVDCARSRRALKRGGAAQMITLHDTALPAGGRVPDVLEMSDALDQLAKVDERKARVVELRYFGGMSRDEISTTLAVSVATVKRDLRLGEAFLRRLLLSEPPQ
jgi:RNA polymerase sigma-70 factor (ECF subfamily)